MSQATSKARSQVNSTAGQRVKQRFVLTLLLAFIVNASLNTYDSYQRGFEVTKLRLKNVYRTDLQLTEERNPYTQSLGQSVNRIGAWLAAKVGLLEVAAHTQTQKITLPAEFKSAQAKTAKTKWHVSNTFDEVKQGLLKGWVLCLLTLQGLWVKLLLLFSASLLFLFALSLGLLDGLVSRYVRTLEAGRESAFLFHRVGNLLLAAPTWVLLGYLLVPNDFYINAFINALAVMLFYLSFSVSSNLKKYL